MFSCVKETDKPLGNNKVEMVSTVTTDITYTAAQSKTQLANEIGNTNIMQHGHCWSIQPDPDISKTHTSLGVFKVGKIFSSNLTDLQPGTIYYVTPYITLNAIVIYGAETSFITPPSEIPTVTTTSTTNFTQTTATISGNVTSDGGATITARGVCWSTSSGPTIANDTTIDGSGSGNFTSNLSGLNNNITYYAKAYATNALGTSYGNEVSFTLYLNVPDTSVTDIDGNVYQAVKIGTQIWLTENLKVTKYRDGSTIPLVTDGTIWASQISGAYCDWGNNTLNGATYGHLYNFYSVVDDRQVCPSGWHVPSQSEWSMLINYLGGYKVAGIRLKEVGTAHWEIAVGDNSSGFAALGGSWRGGDGAFYYYTRHNGCFWSTTFTNNSPNNPWVVFLPNSTEVIFNNDSYHNKKSGNSVRCIKD
jgi:uncharacterized protein (TIGR02145 family)